MTYKMTDDNDRNVSHKVQNNQRDLWHTECLEREKGVARSTGPKIALARARVTNRAQYNTSISISTVKYILLHDFIP